MTEAERKERNKKVVKRVWDGSKLVMAIGALTAAINGYAELSQKSVKLSEQNAALYQALSSKVNSMAEKLAYLQGRVDGLNSAEASEAVKDKIKPLSAPEPAPEPSPTGGGVEDMMDEMDEGANAEPDPFGPEAVEDESPAMAKPPPSRRPRHSFQVEAYQQLPENLKELQKQIQIQEEM